MTALRLGTRGSPLARVQTALVAEALRLRATDTTAVEISTLGDRDRATSLNVLGGQGVFVREIEAALTAGRIDVGVHSAKDVPTALAPGTCLAAYLPRADVRDVVVTAGGVALDALPPGARVGTSSRRRAAQLRARWPHLICTDVRGNVETRLRKLADGEYAAVVLAAAGLARLGRLNVACAVLEPDVMLPAPGQGAIVLQARLGDVGTLAALRPLSHPGTETAVRAERAVLAVLGVGCTLPVGALGCLDGSNLHLVAAVFQPDGRRAIRVERAGPAADPEAVGRAAGEALLAQGAAAMLAEVNA